MFAKCCKVCYYKRVVKNNLTETGQQTMTTNKLEMLIGAVEEYNELAGEEEAICWFNDITDNIDINNEKEVTDAHAELKNRIDKIKGDI